MAVAGLVVDLEAGMEAAGSAEGSEAAMEAAATEAVPAAETGVGVMAAARAAAVGVRCWAGTAAETAKGARRSIRLCKLTVDRTATAAAAAKTRRRASAGRGATRAFAGEMVSGPYFLRRGESVAYPKRQKRKALARCAVSR